MAKMIKWICINNHRNKIILIKHFNKSRCKLLQLYKMLRKIMLIYQIIMMIKANIIKRIITAITVVIVIIQLVNQAVNIKVH